MVTRVREAPSGPFVSTLPEGVWNVVDFGAVARPISFQTPSDEERTNNVLAIQAALDAAFEAGGGTVLFPPGVYYTNDRVGYFIDFDVNCPVILRGLSQITMIYSNNDSACVLGFMTTDGNIRDVTVIDLMLHGGREGLLLYNCDYSVFERIWGWGSKNFSFQCQFCVGVDFVDCRFDESAQGNATGVEADAVLLVSCEAEFNEGTRWGEFCGGIVMSNGYNQIGGLFHDCKLRRGVFFDYQTDTEIVIDGGVLLTRPAAITLSGGYCLLDECYGESVARWVLVFRGVELEIGDVRIQAAPGFVGFVDVWPDGSLTSATNLALNMHGTYQFNELSGFLIGDLESSLQSAIVECQSIVLPGGAMTPISTSAPALLNPHFEENSVNIVEYFRFVPTDVPQVAAWLDLAYGTIAGVGYSVDPDQIVSNPAVQTTDARRPVNGLSPSGLPMMTFDAAGNSSLSWPLVPTNNQASKTGFACWVKQPVSAAGFEAIFVIGGGTGGANVQKLGVLLLPTQAINVQLFANNAGGRQGTTATGVFAADTWFFLRWVYDSTQATEALRSKLYINEVLVSQTFSDLGVGAPVTTLQVGTGNAIIGNADDSGVTTRTFNGSLGQNAYVLAGDVLAVDGVSLMNYKRPVAA